MLISDSVSHDLDAVNTYIKKLTLHNISAITQISRYLVNSGGKMIRPFLVILTSRMFNVPRDKYVKIAAAIEMYHSASLLHDDVVDGAGKRRGTPSANNIWGNKSSVLVGDFLLASSSAVIAGIKDQELLELFVKIMALMVEGELIQLKMGHNIELSEKEYYTIIKKKTAYLISASCESGAIMGKTTDAMRYKLRRYGLLIGTAFQLIDDNIDYTSSIKVSGKDRGADLKEGKITLPMIIALSNADRREKAILKKVLSKHENSDDYFEKVCDIIEKYHGFEYTKKRADNFEQKAFKLLDGLPPSAELDELKRFTLTLVKRKS